MNRNNSSGFTVVELLIVIITVAILTSVSVAAFSGVQNRSRDTERKTDIRNIAQQIEMYYQEKGSYPPFLQSGVGISVASWRTANMPGVSDALLTPPGTSGVSLVNNTTPTVGQYGYHNAGTCTGNVCTKYRLYWRSDVDSHVEMYTGSTG